jgi:hypothetical protein
MARLPSQLTYNDLNGSEATEILVDWFRQLLQRQALLQPHLTLPMADIHLGVHVDINMYIGGTVPIASPPEHEEINGSISLTNHLSAFDSASSTEDLYAARRLREQPVSEHREDDLSTRVNAAPIPGGSPPDQIREQHDLPVPRPGYGSRDTGSHLFLSDVTDETTRRASETGGREGVVADGYTFSRETANTTQVLDSQSIELENGEIKIDLAGAGVSHAGMLVKDDSHRKSKKEFGDRQGERYSSVNGVIDPGPAGLMNRRGGGGLGSDGRQRLNFGNNNRG